MLDLDPIKKRLAAAAPGPWSDPWQRDDEPGNDTVRDAKDEPVFWADYYDGPRQAIERHNAALIAHAPADLAGLVAEVERLRVIEDAADRLYTLGTDAAFSALGRALSGSPGEDEVKP